VWRVSIRRLKANEKADKKRHDEDVDK